MFGPTPQCGLFYIGANPFSYAPSPVSLHLEHVSARAIISSHGATVTVKQRTRISPSNKTDETSTDATIAPIPFEYIFPIPTTGAVTNFKATLSDSRVIVGECFPVEEAKEKYITALKETDCAAGLASSHTPDLFKISLGNLGQSSTVEVEVEYVTSLEYDTQYSAFRFTLPTSVFPRYGIEPVDIETADHTNISVNSPENGVFISVESVQDPESPSTMKCVSHEARSDDTRITFSNEKTYLEKDFAVILSYKTKSNITATYEPTINRSTKISTLPTKALSNVLSVAVNPADSKELSKPSSLSKEIVFILDRSGSMYDNVKTLKNAMRLFVSSLPTNETTFFNFISFGSNHSKMWPKSRPLNEKSFASAQKYIDSIDADMGGTEILEPLKTAVKSRLTEKNKEFETEIILLTDGEVFNIDEIHSFVQKTQQTTSNNIRFFALGIGYHVSHALLDLIVSAGKGYKQVVMPEEHIEKKVIKLLKTSLSVHVKSVDIYWQQEAQTPDKDFEVINNPVKPLHYDLNSVPVSTIGRDAKFMVTPEHGPLPIFPDWNSKMYIFFEDESMLLPYIKIVVHLNGGNKVEFEAPIAKAKETTGSSYSSIAAAKQLLGELERSNLISSYDKKLIGETTGLYFNLMSPWTSMVAVEDSSTERKVIPLKENDNQESFDMPYSAFNATRGFVSRGRLSSASAPKPLAPGVGGMLNSCPPPPMAAAAKTKSAKFSLFRKKSSGPAFGSSIESASAMSVQAVPTQAPQFQQSRSLGGALFGSSAVAPSPQSDMFAATDYSSDLADTKAPVSSTDDYDVLSTIVKHSKFDGSYSPSEDLLATIFKPEFKTRFDELHQIVGDIKGAKSHLDLLALAVWLFLSSELKDLHESWEILADKTLAYVERSVDENEISKYRALLDSTDK